MLDSRDIGGLQGAPVLGRDNEKLGTVGQVFLDSQTGAPNWVTVKTGLFGHKETFVPLVDADFNGEELSVDIDKETLKEAPRIDAHEELSPHNEEALYRYYGLSDQDTDGGTARPDEYPDREYRLNPDGTTVTPVPVGTADAELSRSQGGEHSLDADRDRDTDRSLDSDRNTDADRLLNDERRADAARSRDLDGDGRVDDDDRRTLTEENIGGQRASGTAVPAEDTGFDTGEHHNDGPLPDHVKRAADDDRPRDLNEFHPDKVDLNEGQRPGEGSAVPADEVGQTGQAQDDGAPKHARMRRYDPSLDGTTAGDPTIDRSSPPRTL